MPCSRISFESVASDRALPVTLGKINPTPPASSRVSASTLNARSLSGTLCYRPVLARIAGTVQVSPSISSHCASRTSPDRAAVKSKNSNARTVARYAPDAHTVSIATATSPCGNAGEMPRRLSVPRQGRVEGCSGGIVRPVALGHCPTEDPAKPLLYAAHRLVLRCPVRQHVIAEAVPPDLRRASSWRNGSPAPSSLAWASVGTELRGSWPLARARRFSRAAFRASASVTTGNEPSPMLTGLPLMRSRWLQVRECPPSFIGLTSSESPWLPRPSP